VNPPSGAPLLRGRRIVLVFGTLELGGSERQAILLAEHLKEVEGADVRVFGLMGDRGKFARMCEERGIPARIVRAGWPEGRFRKLAALADFAGRIRAERPDVLMSYHWLPNVLCGLTWRLSGARTCVWNQRNAGIGLDGSRLHRLAVRLTPCFLSNSGHGRDFLIGRYGVPAGRVRVVPNGIRLAPPADTRAAWRNRLGIGPDVVLGCMVANIHPNKDHGTLLRAWRKTLDRAAAEGRPLPVLLLAGRIDEATGLKALAFDLGLGDRLRVAGPVDDVAGLLGAVDFCVHSSRSEGCPNAVLEAMAAGKPVIASDIPGVREAVGPDGSSLLFPAGDAGALADRICGILADPGESRALAGRLVDRVAREFDVRAMCESTAASIAEALAGGFRDGTAGS
jgi:glycosyltransferase involved in cell wall biosynthesis